MSELSICPRTGEDCKMANLCEPANRPLIGIIPLVLAQIPGTTRVSASTQINRALVEEGDALHSDLMPLEVDENFRVCPIGAIFGPLGAEHGEEVIAGILEVITDEAVDEATSRLAYMSGVRELNRTNRT
jgi:hypothetical protein